MVEINIAYQGDLHCRAIHEPSGMILETDAPKDNMGKGESFSPTDLVATALGACMLTIMGIMARRLEVDIDGATVKVVKEMAAQPIRRIGRLTVTIDVPRQVPEDIRQRFENGVLTCPVHKSLHPDIEIPITFNWA